MGLGTNTIDGNTISLELADEFGDCSGLRADTLEVVLNACELEPITQGELELAVEHLRH